jgi:hypothetical protein
LGGKLVNIRSTSHSRGLVYLVVCKGFSAVQGLKNKKYLRALDRKFLVDSAATSIFWTIVYIPVFLYTSKSLNVALIGLASTALLEGLLGGPYGKFLDWFRHRFVHS